MWLRDFLRVRTLIFIFVTRTFHTNNLRDLACNKYIYIASLKIKINDLEIVHEFYMIARNSRRVRDQSTIFWEEGGREVLPINHRHSGIYSKLDHGKLLKETPVIS